MDPDLGGPKTCGSGSDFGSGSPTLVLTYGSPCTQENLDTLRYTAVSSGTGEGDFEKMKAILAAVPGRKNRRKISEC